MDEPIPLAKAMHFQNTLEGHQIEKTVRTAAELKGFYEDSNALRSMHAHTIMYEVDSYFPVNSGTAGGLFFGITRIHPGKVGDEYFMTKGHFHKMKDRGEFYWGMKGEGLLVLMDEERNTRAEKVGPGSIHYIPGFTAHRVCNTGKDTLVFGACWPSDAGHDYTTILEKGFSVRVMEIGGKAKLVVPANERSLKNERL